MKKQLTLACLSLCLVLANAQTPIYKQAGAPIAQRVEDLLGRMTMEEKALQLTQGILGENDNPNNIMTPTDATQTTSPMIGSVIFFAEGSERRNVLQKRAMEESRLGIPIIFGNDVIHGYRTVYPIPLANSCTWNPALYTRCCEMAAREAYTMGLDWTFSPMIDVSRDPRWGRIAECYGEDPYLNAVFAQAAVRGYQGDDPGAENHVAATLKHFVGYGASEGGRDYVAADFSDQTLWETYMPPYKAGVEAGVKAVMSAFNDINGIPASANHYTLTEVLRNQWHFQGLVVSDWQAVRQLIRQNFAADNAEAALRAITAGVDLDMNDNVYKETLSQLVADGRLKQEVVDEAVRRVLRVKFELGLFEHPYTPVHKDGKNLLQPDDVKMAEQAAEESMVLLQNKNQLLPLRNVKRLAVVGPMADERKELLGSWYSHGRPSDVVPIVDAFRQEFQGKAEVTFAHGCDVDGDDQSGFAEALDVARQADVVVVCLGEKHDWSGENAPRASIDLTAIQRRLLDEMTKAQKPIILLLANGRPLELTQMIGKADAVLEMWQPGVAGGKPAAGIVSGRVNPSGKLTATFPYSVKQVPIYYNRRNPARTDEQGYYQDLTVEPLYPFGYGLSYSTFEYGELKLSADKVPLHGQLDASVTVTNTSQIDGMETVLWFVSDPVCSVVARPIKELKHFEKVMIPAGQSYTYHFAIDVDRDFGYVDRNGRHFVEPGVMNVMVGNQTVKVNVVE